MATSRLILSAAVTVLAVQAHAQPIAADDLGPAPLIRPAEGPGRPAEPFTGRVSAIAASPTDANKFFVSGPGSGVWRFEAPPATPNDYTWTPLTDDMPTLAVGALAIDPNAENIIYAGTGDAEFAHHSPYGLGLYKSVDSGDTWSHLAESTFGGRSFSRIVIDPTPVEGESPTLYASIVRAGGFPEASAAKLHPDRWGPVGVFKSTDGGATWTHLTNGLPQLSATDLAIDPSNPNVLYAAIGHIFGDEDNGSYKTTNGGATWSMVTSTPFPAGVEIGRVSIAVAPTDPDYVYALVAGDASATGGGAFNEGGFRSTDGGDTWEEYGGVAQRFHGWYTSAVTVSPTDEDIVYYGGF